MSKPTHSSRIGQSEQRQFESTAAALDQQRGRFVARGGRAPAEAERLVREEIWASSLLAGVRLDYPAVEALVERNWVGAGPLDAFVLVADYAAAARQAAAAPLPGPRGVFLRLGEVVAAHATATRREPSARPGQWRTATLRAFPSGAVPSPAWRVPRDMTALVERLVAGPPATMHPVAWVANAHERFARIHPFTRGNGRTSRIVANLLLRRTGYPPFAVRGRAAERYLAAFGRADSRDPWPMALVFARALLESQTRLADAAEPESAEMRPLAAFASGPARAALYKASQRGRLRTVRRGGALLTSAAWIADYESSRRGPR